MIVWQHKILVKAAVHWVYNFDFLGEGRVVFTDEDTGNGQTKPNKIHGHVPDVFAKDSSLDREVICEAKTPSDLVTKRSNEQIENFIRYCSDSEKRVIVLATQWDNVQLARSIILRVCESCGVSYLNYSIIDEFFWEE